MSKKKIILFSSKSMDNSTERNEDGLLRLSASARSGLGFIKETVELWSTGDDAHLILKPHKAFLDDIRLTQNLVKRGELKSTDLNRVGFVTTKMARRLFGADPDKTIWISDESVEETLIGTDPEFLLFDDKGKVIHANRLMSKEGEVGSDGAMAELRPKPSSTPEGLIANISRLLKDHNLTSKIQPYDWRAACYHKDPDRDYGVGGHIHVGNPTRVSKLSMARREVFFNVLNKIIDELLSIPMTKLDGEQGMKRRTQCAMSNGHGGWGYFGEWRPANGRLEHRTLSGLWMTSPKLAECVIGTAKAIADEAFKLWTESGFNDAFITPPNAGSMTRAVFYHPSFDKWCEIPICKEMRATRSSAEMKGILNESKVSLISKPFLTQWLSTMKNLSTYNQYEKYIVGLKTILEKSASKEVHSIKNTWVNT